ncbi:MAG: hypothetical protein WC205_03675 [Opitutaceae bacterium]|jgi:hypothetical protein
MKLSRSIIISSVLLFCGTFTSFADEITVTFPASPRFPVFPHGQPIEMTVWAHRDNPKSEDVLTWEIVDFWGRSVTVGVIDFAAGKEQTFTKITLNDLPAGYLSVSAIIKGSSTGLPRRGSRPEGMATFGVLSPVSALPLKSPADSRFGIQGTNFIKSGIFLQGDPYEPLYPALGIHWVNVQRSWADAEADHAGQYQPKDPVFTGETGYMANSNLEPLFCVFNLPWWAIDFPSDFRVDHGKGSQRQSFPPKDYALYGDYLKKMAAHQVAIRKAEANGEPISFENHYQIGWEPDWHWKGTDEQFVKLYRTVGEAIHAADPDAMVMGPGDGVLKQAIARLERTLPLGLADGLDGLAVHGYYTPFGNPLAVEPGDKLISPEDGGVIDSLRKVRSLMREYFKPGAKLFQTEWGLDYRSTYLDLTTELLKMHAAYITRGHLLFLGEGCDMTYFFYTADYGNLKHRGEDGYGMCFNLTMPDPSFGAVNISPKPVFMSAATLTRVLEGTRTLGPVDLGNPGICAYAFQRGDDVALAVWSRDNESHEVTIPVAGDAVTLVGFMGNTSALNAHDGTVTLKADRYPQYLIGKIPAEKTLR